MMREFAMIGRRCHNCHELGPSFFGDTHADNFEPVRFLFEFRPVSAELLVVRQAKVVTDIETEKLFRRRYRGGGNPCRFRRTHQEPEHNKQPP